jgi:hypothetical protein
VTVDLYIIRSMGLILRQYFPDITKRADIVALLDEWAARWAWMDGWMDGAPPGGHPLVSTNCVLLSALMFQSKPMLIETVPPSLYNAAQVL